MTTGTYFGISILPTCTKVYIGSEDMEHRVWDMPLGSSNLTDQYLLSDPPLPDELSAALSIIELYIDDLVRENDGLESVISDSVVTFGSGLVEQVAVVEDGQRREDYQNYLLSSDNLEELFRSIATEPLADRVYNPGLKEEFASGIVGACCILAEFFRQLDIDKLIVFSSVGLKEFFEE